MDSIISSQYIENVFHNVISAQSSDTEYATASSVYSDTCKPYKSFDRDYNTTWSSQAYTYWDENRHWLKFKFT